MRRRFNDTGKDLVTCTGCGSQRLPNWMEFETSFYGRVQRIFDMLDVDGDGKLSQHELSVLAKKTGDVTDADLNGALERDFDIKALCSFYHISESELLSLKQHVKLSRHEEILGTCVVTAEDLYGDDFCKTVTETVNLCVHCAVVAKAHTKGITCHKCFLGNIEDPVFPVNNDREHPSKSMEFIARGFLDSNYRQPACLADVATTQHAGGGQKGALQIHHVDPDSVSGRAVRYEHVEIDVDVRTVVRALVHQDVTSARKSMQKLTDKVFEAYVVALTKELIEATACVIEGKKSKKQCGHPDVLVLAPGCSDDPEFVHRLKQKCVKQNGRIRQLVKNDQIQFGTVGEWTGSDCPLVILTGFHQPYHLLANVGCYRRDDLLSVSAAESERLEALENIAGTSEDIKLRRRYNPVFRDNWNKFYLSECGGEERAMLEQRQSILESRLKQIPVDTLLYIAVTRATWGLSVVEPFPRRFAAHYQIGVEGRSLSRAGKPFTAHWSYVSDENVPKSRMLRNAQVLLDEDSENTSINFSGKDLELVPKCVIDLVGTEILDLSVNNLKRLPNDLWNLPLHTLDVSYNPSLGRVLLLVLDGAARCKSLQQLRLRAVMGQGGGYGDGLSR